MKKKIALICCFILIVSALAGCGVKQKAEEKVAEKIVEGIGGGDVDIDGDKITVKGKDGGEFTMGSTEWPDSEIAKAIPEFTKGKINAVIESTEGVIIAVDSVEEADYKNYLETIKTDFADDAYEMNTQDYSSYGASNSNGVGVLLRYGDNSLSITVTKVTE